MDRGALRRGRDRDSDRPARRPLARERDALPEWDGDSQDDIARTQELFKSILAHVPARYIEDVATGLDSPQWGTRMYVAGALAEHDRDTTLPILRNALAAEGDGVMRQILTRWIEHLSDGNDTRPSTHNEKK